MSRWEVVRVDVLARGRRYTTLKGMESVKLRQAIKACNHYNELMVDRFHFYKIVENSD